MDMKVYGHVDMSDDARDTLVVEGRLPAKGGQLRLAAEHDAETIFKFLYGSLPWVVADLVIAKYLRKMHWYNENAMQAADQIERGARTALGERIT
jgi:hypothetical protein